MATDAKHVLLPSTVTGAASEQNWAEGDLSHAPPSKLATKCDEGLKNICCVLREGFSHLPAMVAQAIKCIRVLCIS